MNIHLLAVGTRMPAWVSQGYHEYSKRMPRECSIKLVEIAPGHRGKNAATAKAIEDEGKRMLAAIPKGAHVIALDEKGKSWSTLALSQQLQSWMQLGCDIALLIGGPDGLAPSCRNMAHASWSLSALTLPHPLVRVMLAEQLYRALSVLQHHPYHRE